MQDLLFADRLRAAAQVVSIVKRKRRLLEAVVGPALLLMWMEDMTLLLEVVVGFNLSLKNSCKTPMVASPRMRIYGLSSCKRSNMSGGRSGMGFKQKSNSGEGGGGGGGSSGDGDLDDKISLSIL